MCSLWSSSTRSLAPQTLRAATCQGIAVHPVPGKCLRAANPSPRRQRRRSRSHRRVQAHRRNRPDAAATPPARQPLPSTRRRTGRTRTRHSSWSAPARSSWIVGRFSPSPTRRAAMSPMSPKMRQSSTGCTAWRTQGPCALVALSGRTREPRASAFSQRKPSRWDTSSSLISRTCQQVREPGLLGGPMGPAGQKMARSTPLKLSRRKPGCTPRCTPALVAA
mmetsp:Transcript_25998/g.71534  ORF Transcript_25998/g.71534 Transcript_25998/m.71534 type:complete len:221 (+) Transcript_25998:334-996(+)